MLINSPARLAARRLSVVVLVSIFARWQQLRNTRSGTVSMRSISAAVSNKPSDNTTPLRRIPSVPVLWKMPWAATTSTR
ncbi:hypothetical protein D3C87_2109090 [compost metagenome]